MARPPDVSRDARARILACPAKRVLTTDGYAREYNILRHLDADDVRVDAYVGVDRTGLETDTAHVHEFGSESGGKYYARAFAHAYRTIHRCDVDVYHHLSFGRNDFNPLLAAGATADLPVVVGPAEAGHVTPPDELWSVVERTLPISIPNPIQKSAVATRAVRALDPIREALFRATLANVDRLVAVHSDAAAFYSQFIDESRIDIVPYGVPLEAFPYSDDRSECAFLTVGNLIHRKRHDVILRAMRDVVNSYPDAELTVVGTGPEEDRLRELVDRLGLTENVDFVGHVSTERLVDLYQSALAFVHASSSEGYSHVRLEAMATGCPVIGTDVDGARDITVDGETGFIVPTDSADALADAMRTLLNDPSLAASMTDRSRERAEERFDYRTIAAQYVEIYRDLLADAHRTDR